MSSTTIPKSLLHLWTARLASKIAICSAMTYDLYQLSKSRGKDGALKLGVADEGKRQLAKVARQEKEKRQEREARSVEDVFISSLVAAGSCRNHSARVGCSWVRETRPRRERARRSWDVRKTTRRDFSTFHSRQQGLAIAAQQPEETRAEPPVFSKEEYHDLVQTYDTPSDMWEQDVSQPHQEHLPLAPRLVIPPEQESRPPFAPREVLEPEDEQHARGLARMSRMLKKDTGRISLARFWQLFQSLPSPRLRYIHDEDIRLAFRHLSWVEYKSPYTLSRYMSLLEECIGEGIPIETEEWTTAISFAGRWVYYTTSNEVKQAVEMWMRMERYGNEADNVTFNILFDIAVKAGRFALADMIFAELRARDLPLNRYFRTSMIYYAGTRGDGDAVRQAFRDLVNSGEIVDTTIMNCVIISLIRAGEPAAAEHVFGKMKLLYEQKLGTAAPASWRDRKELGVLLDRIAVRLRKEKDSHQSSFFGSQFSADERKEEVQKAAPIKPNSRTYFILIQHHAYTSGDIDRLRALIDEMRQEGHHIHGSVYLHIFRGFWYWGGQSYTAWNRSLLEQFWSQFVSACRSPDDLSSPGAMKGPPLEVSADDMSPDQFEENRAPYFTRSLVRAVIRAFHKCAGVPRLKEVWEEVREKWPEMTPEDEDKLRNQMRKEESGAF